MYSENKTKIRRFLRDPNANLWDDTFLLNLWNDEQRTFTRQHGLNEAVTVLRVPPYFQGTYIYPWEWTHAGPVTGKTYQAMSYQRQSQIVCCYPWETQQLGPTSASETATGDRFTHPWEAYAISNPIDLTPIWLPGDFHSALYLAYDEEPLEFCTFKEITSRDQSYKIYNGDPQWWTTKEDFEQFFYLYPRPSAVWDDIDGAADTGMVLHDEDSALVRLNDEGILIDAAGEYVLDANGDYIYTADYSEAGTIIDATGDESTDSEGAAVDLLDTADNVLLIYRQYQPDIVANGDSPGYPRWMQKYIEYGVLAQAYRANTDGKIKSLSDYWEWRKSISAEVLMRYKFKRLEDRDFRLTGFQAPPRRRRGPRLPSTYPPI